MSNIKFNLIYQLKPFSHSSHIFLTYLILIPKFESCMEIFIRDNVGYSPVSQALMFVFSPAGVWFTQGHRVGSFGSTMAHCVCWSWFLLFLLWEEMYTD